MPCDAQYPIDGAFSIFFFPIRQRLERAKRHVSIGFESMQKNSSTTPVCYNLAGYEQHERNASCQPN